MDATAAKPSAPKPTTAPTYCFYTLKLQEGADKPAITEAMKSYCTAAKASLGKLDGCYGMTESELVFFDVMDSPLAMDIHIGNCFPHYIKMLAGSKICDFVNIVDPKNVAWWKESTAVWGAEKHIVSPPGSGGVSKSAPRVRARGESQHRERVKKHGHRVTTKARTHNAARRSTHTHPRSNSSCVHRIVHTPMPEHGPRTLGLSRV